MLPETIGGLMLSTNSSPTTAGHGLVTLLGGYLIDLSPNGVSPVDFSQKSWGDVRRVGRQTIGDHVRYVREEIEE